MKIEKVIKFPKNKEIVLKVLEGYRYLERNKLCDGDMDYALWGNALVARNRGGRIVGVMTYQDHEEGLWVNLSYIEKNYRRRGIYKSLYEKLKEICIEDKKKFIKSSTHISNKPMQLCAKMTGRTVGWVGIKWDNK